ncbi:histidine kinase CKI1-like [Rosa rugosa]|uniref:histidine kinase CKI1-like n=1 Tax=Rosa rugosa TaxID=74645 RepID=UPI002B4167D9|nr:histidine kinase CKI1-like [Rosa rugosa]
MRRVFFVLLVTGLVVVVLSGLLISVIKHVEHNVYVLAFSESGLINLVHKDCRMAIVLLIVMIVIMALFLFSYFFLMLAAAKREIQLCTKLIKQDEAIRQAETKSMKKSDAITSASHDVRNALACMTELIKISCNEVSQGSEIKKYLTQMEACTKHLLGILNSILDKSKIEAGKMVLEDEEFDIFQLVEEVIDFFLPSGLKKGVDVMLDPYDCSLLKFAHVRGDRRRLKQILCNLLGNAVKFTSEGHVTVRAWVQKPSFMNSITAADSDQNNGFLKHLLCFLNYKNMTKEQSDGIKAVNGVQHDPNYLDFVFEVDDSGRGIPKEKQKEVFENYVQVKEKAHGEGGTGLGLGIVQSLVRLMHGEIGIVDKEIGEKGTCFRFNVLLRAINVCGDHIKLQQDLELGGDPSCDDRDQQLGLIANANPRLTIIPSPNLTPIGSPRLNVFCTTPSSAKVEESIVVLLIKNEERRRIVYQFMKSSLGIKVSVVEQWGQLAHTLKKIKHMRMKGHPSSSSGISDLGLQDCLSKSTPCNSGNRAKEVHPLMSAMDETYNNMCSLFKKTTTNVGGAPAFILLVIDTTAGPYMQLCKIITEFKRGLQNASCRTVWLENPQSHRLVDLSGLDPDDVIIKRALHGTCLFEVVRFLPEYGGALPNRSAGDTFQVGSKVVSRAPSPSRYRLHTDDESDISSSPIQCHDQSHNVGSTSRNSPVGHDHPHPHRETHEHGNPSTPLSGKKILVAEDDELLSYLAMRILLKEGATVKLCKNGREALDVIRIDLDNQGKHEYDFVLMDCQMPEMDGFEATREIRKVEKTHHVRIPIIALTAHTPGEETRRMLEAGMDDYLSKPLEKDRLLETMGRLVGK